MPYGCCSKRWTLWNFFGLNLRRIIPFPMERVHVVASMDNRHRPMHFIKSDELVAGSVCGYWVPGFNDNKCKAIPDSTQLGWQTSKDKYGFKAGLQKLGQHITDADLQILMDALMIKHISPYKFKHFYNHKQLQDLDHSTKERKND
ncbi:hypothetical protein L1987_31181 [Smallanthus sonchifolius]|uniref:Uncharacterized protein n=1 Tax=Smallanthus sonchifolius TaxID=185202 RepID=A0ACB9I472_9ASTR|nr:hypothetical protein L1987_31181 [Smallanthus sonchifolius]